MSTKKLGRATDQRLAMVANLATDLLWYGRIETTLEKAKDLQKVADKMVTLAKKNTLASRRQAASFVRFETNEEGQLAIQKLFNEYGPKYADRNGGYTRVLKLGPRRGDAAEMAIIEYI